MYKQWAGKNVDLTLLKDCVVNFFRDKGFENRSIEEETKYVIIGRPKTTHGNLEDVTVRICGKSDNFTVEFIAGEKAHSSILLGFLTSLFGGGSFVLKGAKSQEELTKLEGDFWLYVEEKVACLSGSFRHEDACK